MTPFDAKLKSTVGEWDENRLGNHRVQVRVEKGSEAVYIRIPWRRRDTAPERKRVIIIDAATGNELKNVFPLSITREEGEFIFQPETVPGDCFVYYLPFQSSGSPNYPRIVYLSPESRSNDQWLKRLGDTATIRSRLRNKTIPEAALVRFQSKEEWDSFFPMERIATPAETAMIVSRHRGHPFLLFAEDRRNPVRMNRDIPDKWIKPGPFNLLETEAAPGEYLTFQIALYAAFGPVTISKLEVSDLISSTGEFLVSGQSFTCFNLEGIDWRGNSFRKVVEVGANMVHPFWVGVMLPDSVHPGLYRVIATLTDGKGIQDSIPVSIRISGPPIPAHGDDDPTRLSRLRWLNSQLAAEDDPVAPFSPLKRNGMRISLLGRDLEIDNNGFPRQIHSYFTPAMTGIGSNPRQILGDAIRLVVTDAEGKEFSKMHGKVEFSKETAGKIGWRSTGRYGPISMNLEAAIEFDGFAEFDISLTAERFTRVNDIDLVVPIQGDVARYMTGLGFRGGFKPDVFSWKWDTKNNQDSIWLGDVNAGLQCAFRDVNYSRPLNTNFYLLKPLQLPPSWYNNGKGSIGLERNGTLVRIHAASGAREITKGETLHFVFTLLITPFKPLNTKSQFQTRYYHDFKPVDEIRATGANVINVHHANSINPYINYPFLRPTAMKRYVEEAHEKGMRVKIYYTVRELTNRAPEFFPLFSLGNEVFFSGPGGGFSWLQEHLNSDYITGWLVPELKDAAVVTSGVSRWHNHYVEGLAWLVKNMKIDGIYIDDVAFDRSTMKRVRRVLDNGGPGALIDLHSANQFNVRDGFASSTNLYMEHFPFIDRLWFGEYFDYNSPPDYWLIEISGIPFGLMGEMLQDGGNPWRGMLYGMTSRLPWSGDPRPIWKALDEFGIDTADMIGYWQGDAPVKTDHTDILSTVYKKEEQALIALASWNREHRFCRLAIDWQRLGFTSRPMRLRAMEIQGFQESVIFRPTEPIPVAPGRGWLLILEPVPDLQPKKAR